jgi:hypothetical protein
VLLDGGIRRGWDVVKALALGARAVLIGRAYLWGLAANGQAGLGNVLDILRGGIDSALLGLGKASIRDLSPDDLAVPPGFTRTLGGDGPFLHSVLDGQAVKARTLFPARHEADAGLDAEPWGRVGSAPACRGCEQAQSAGVLDGLAPPVRAELRVEVVHVGLDRVR